MVHIKQPQKKTSLFLQDQLSTQMDSCEMLASEIAPSTWHTKILRLTKCKDTSQFAFDLVPLMWDQQSRLTQGSLSLGEEIADAHLVPELIPA